MVSAGTLKDVIVGTTVKTADSTRLDAFFAALLEGFIHAQKVQGTRSVNWIIASKAVRLSLAGEELAHLTRPLEHVRSGTSSPPELSIFAWAGPEDYQLPDIPWQSGSQEDTVGLSTERFRINYHEPSSHLCMWDRQSQRALYWVRRAADLPFWEIASPFRIPLHWWAQSWGGQLAHAAAVGVDGRGVLLVGRGGSGKSTAALACLRQGLDFLGDDHILLTADPVPAAHSVYSSAKMQATSLAKYFPDWMAHIGARVGPEAKCVLYLPELAGLRVNTHLELCGIMAPQVTADASPTIVPATPGHTWLALVPSTVFQLPDARQTTLEFFSDFTRRLPSFGLATGRDLELLPKVLRAFLTSGCGQEKGVDLV
jgi:hypothetical protein